MSEMLPGIPAAPRPAKPRLAASIILARPGAQGLEVFWVRREKTLAFAPGYYAFPGGGVDPQDARTPVEGAESPEAATLRAAAARELFEETGILVARGVPPGPEAVSEGRAALLEKKVELAEWLKRRRAHAPCR